MMPKGYIIFWHSLKRLLSKRNAKDDLATTRKKMSVQDDTLVELDKKIAKFKVIEDDSNANIETSVVETHLIFLDLLN